MANDGEGPETWAARREKVKATNNENRSSEWASGPNLGEALGVTPSSPRNNPLLPTPAASEQARNARFGQYAPAIARQEQAFGYPAPSPTEPGKNGKPRLSARFAEWMMGAPPGWITDTPGVTRNEALRMAGNGVVRQQAFAALIDMRQFVPR